MSWKTRLLEYYEKNETKADLGFFLGGILFDILTLSDIDDPVALCQQVVYLFVIGSFLYFDFLHSKGIWTVPVRLSRIWDYRSLIVHFLLGSLLSLYSLFFVKSASFFASFLFLLAMAALMVANELKSVQRRGVDLKVGLFFICVFSFFSMVFPVFLGFVGWTPFLLSCVATGFVLYLLYRRLLKRLQESLLPLRFLVFPGASVILLFFISYLFGIIPPVPLSAQDLGIYHRIEKSEGRYEAWHQRPWWRFWHDGDQDFVAEPGDALYFFAKIFSPARFNDAVILHWQFDNPQKGWTTTDRIPMRVTGGRKSGYRGFTIKQNYEAGDWRVKVETTDGREIGRLSFTVTKVPTSDPSRVFQSEIF